jgi:phage-related protein
LFAKINPMYRISFYTPVGKISPIKQFLDSCQQSLRAKILRQLKYVQEYGLNSAIPNLKKITHTPLWELRILGKDNIRIICISLPNREVKVLHLFKKKKQKTPLKELNLTLKRYQEVLDK